MDKKIRKSEEIAIDKATTEDTLQDADLSSAEVVFPPSHEQIELYLRVENELIQLCEKIAALKYFENVTHLIRKYIQDGIEKARELLNSQQSNDPQK